MRPRVSSLVLAALLGLALAGCASVQPPQLRVDKIGVEKAGISGLGLEVFFTVRNPNDEALVIERFDYELSLNGQRLGRGDYGGELRIAPYGSERVVSEFQLSWFNLPGGVKRVLDEEEARAHVDGRFLLRRWGSAKWLDFSSDARVSLRGTRDRDEY